MIFLCFFFGWFFIVFRGSLLRLDFRAWGSLIGVVAAIG